MGSLGWCLRNCWNWAQHWCRGSEGWQGAEIKSGLGEWRAECPREAWGKLVHLLSGGRLGPRSARSPWSSWLIWLRSISGLEPPDGLDSFTDERKLSSFPPGFNTSVGMLQVPSVIAFLGFASGLLNNYTMNSFFVQTAFWIGNSQQHLYSKK